MDDFPNHQMLACQNFPLYSIYQDTQHFTFTQIDLGYNLPIQLLYCVNIIVDKHLTDIKHN